jgi:hypothetical protein
MLEDVLRVVLVRRAFFDPQIDPKAAIRVEGGDISSRDNRELAEAGQQIVQVAGSLYEKELIDKAEMLRVVYRCIGERLPGA